MRLGLSSEAAPERTLSDLADACSRRGLQALELVAGHAHGVGGRGTHATRRELRTMLLDRGIVDLLFRLRCAEDAMPPTAVQAAELGATIILPVTGLSGEMLTRAATSCQQSGTVLLLAHGTDSVLAQHCRQLAERHGPHVGLCWDIDPAADELTVHARTVLDSAGPYLRHVQLRGSGPESAGSEGKGIGALLATLAVRGWRGSLALAPSSPDRLRVWKLWLGRRAGWGCGSRTGDENLVTLTAAT